MKIIEIFSLGTTVALIAGCGGGGENSNDEATANNPLKKYEGTYYVCDAIEKMTLQAIAKGSGGLEISYSQDWYSEANCSGRIIGSLRYPNPIRLSHTGVTTATMPRVTILPISGTVDKVSIGSGAMKGTLTGSGVVGSCVKYSYVDGGRTVSGGSSCPELDIPAQTIDGALYLTSNNQYFVTFQLEGGVYTADNIASRDPSFNFKALIPR
jgi:hypothetical protein